MGCFDNEANRGIRGANVGGSDRVDCVADVVRNIDRAQREVAGVDDDRCFGGCDRAINDLLSPSGHMRPTRYDTIPFMLYMQNCGSPFVGSGMIRGRGRDDNHSHSHFHCVESPIFRVKGFSNRRQNCAILELLVPISDKNSSGPTGGLPDKSEKCSCCNQSVCQFFPRRMSGRLRSTGICITVNLDCFCAISCLDPIRLHR